jgi:hypothetical protein
MYRNKECVVAREIRTDQRWVDQHADVEPAERGQHDNNSEEDYRDGRSGEV